MKDEIIKAFQDLVDYHAVKRNKGYQFKIAMYRKAIKGFAAQNSPKDIDDAKRILKTVFKDSKKIESKIQELYNTGRIKAVNRARNNTTIQAIRLLASVPQIGQVKASKLVSEHNITTISQLKEHQHLLNDKQKLGLKYYDELIDPATLDAVRIPRKEIDRFENIVKKLLANLDDVSFEICGSYRRQLLSSGDIDILFNCSKANFKIILDKLKERYIKDPFSDGVSKWMGFVKIDKLHRRIDIMNISNKEYPFALLYFTGSQEFNEALRGYCKKLGYTLNEHNLRKLTNMSVVQGKFNNEQDIFKFLNLKYIQPQQRIGGKFKLESDVETKMSSVSVVQGPKDNIHCLKGKGLGGFSIQELRDIAKSKGFDNTGTKKELCNRMFDKENKGNKLFNVSKGVLLANKYNNGIDPTGYIASEKYDGIRALWNGKDIKSRTNKVIHAPKEYIKYFPKNIALDGELFLNRGSFEKTTSIVSKKIPVDNEWKNIKYMVFNIPSVNKKFTNRLNDLQKVISKSCKNYSKCPLVRTQHVPIKNRNHMKTLYNDVLSKGGEGLMLRDPDSLYQQKRSKTLLKVKPSDDAEAIITNMIEGKGKDEGTMGALKVHLKTNNSKKFKIGSGFTSKLRKNFWSKKNTFIGDTVTFGHKGLTSKGIPRHPTFIRLRANKNV